MVDRYIRVYAKQTITFFVLFMVIFFASNTAIALAQDEGVDFVRSSNNTTNTISPDQSINHIKPLRPRRTITPSNILRPPSHVRPLGADNQTSATGSTDTIGGKQNRATSSRLFRAKERMRERRTRLRETFQGRTTEVKQNLHKVRKDIKNGRLREDAVRRIKAFMARILRRFDAAIVRLEKVADRIEARIEKLEAKGFVLSEASQLLVAARGEVKAASKAIDEVRATIDSVLDSDQPRESFGAVREALSEAKQSIKNAHRALVKSVRAIKSSLSSDDTGPSSHSDISDSPTE
jgi:exonuclease VII small subunit